MEQLVVRPRGVVRERQVDVLGRLALLEERAHGRGDVPAVPGQRHLSPLRLVPHRLERIASDEVVVELHERPVPEVVRRPVVVGDVVGVVAPAERARPFVALGGEPFAIGLQLVAGEDGRQRARDPAGLEGVGGVDAGNDLLEPEVRSRGDDRSPHVLALLPRPPELEAGHTRHAVMQRAHLVSAERQLAHVEELDLRQRAAVGLLQDIQRGRALDLEPVELAAAARIDGRALVARELDVVVAGLGMELHPVVRRGPADQAHAVLFEMEEDPVADDVAVVVAHDELLGLVHREVLEAVDAEVGEQPDRVRALDLQVEHVMGLVEERTRLLPRDLLVPPVRELAGHGGIDVRPDLRVARHLDGAADRLQFLFQVRVAHVVHPPSRAPSLSQIICQKILSSRPRPGGRGGHGRETCSPTRSFPEARCP